MSANSIKNNQLLTVRLEEPTCLINAVYSALNRVLRSGDRREREEEKRRKNLERINAKRLKSLRKKAQGLPPARNRNTI